MSAFNDITRMGGARAQFPPTQWTELQNAKQHEDALNKLLGSYWKPLYCYLRRKGYPNEEAKDLTQGFFSEIILGRDLLQKADQSRGRFRNLLLAALENYSRSLHRHKQRRKTVNTVSLELTNIPETTPVDPTGAFVYAWATRILDKTLDDLQSECCKDGKAIHWKVFSAKVLRPIRETAEAPTLKEICDDLGVKDEVKASNMIITVKRRFKKLLRRQIRQHVVSDAEVDQELEEIVSILSLGCAG